MNDLSRYLEPGGKRSGLIVLLHGMGNASERLVEARSVLRAARPDTDLFAPQLPYGWLLSTVKAELIVANLVAQIDRFVAERGANGYASITLVGHSIGAVLARKIAIVAYGEQTASDGDVPAPFEEEFAAFRAPRPWATRIDRIVLLAGMNRGWSAVSTMNWWDQVTVSATELVGDLVWGGRLTSFAVRRGARFLVQTRLQWLSVMDPDYGPRPDVMVVQLLGTGDDGVAPDDNVDYSVDLYGNGGLPSYFYVEVAGSNHLNVVQMAAAGPPQSAAVRAGRSERFLSALNDSRAQLAEQCISRE